MAEVFNSFGCIPEAIKPGEAIYESIFPSGGIGVGETKNWRDYLSPRKPQYWIPFCVTFARLACARAKAKSEGLIIDFSERDLGVESGTTKNGNYLQTVSDWFKNTGTVLASICEFTYQMLVDGWPFWDAIFALPMIVQTAKRYKGGNHSWVTSIAGMRDALNFSPLQISYGIPQGYEVQSIVQDTGIYSAYHSTTCYWIDSQGRYYIQDSIGKEFKILEANFNLTGIKSFRDLPTDWKDKNFMDKGFTMSGDGKTLIGFFKIHSEEEAKAFGTITNIQVPLKPDGSGKINWEELNKGIVPRNDL